MKKETAILVQDGSQPFNTSDPLAEVHDWDKKLQPLFCLKTLTLEAVFGKAGRRVRSLETDILSSPGFNFLSGHFSVPGTIQCSQSSGSIIGS